MYLPNFPVKRAQKTAHFQSPLLVLSAPAGTGKTTMANALKTACSFLRQAISCTSRSPRCGEREGVDYFFVKRDQFEKEIAKGHFVEWVELFGEYYGTLTSQIKQLQRGGNCVILVIDVKGALKLQRQFPCITIFLLPPNLKELKGRLQLRGGDSDDKIQQRLARAQYEISQSHLFDYQVINDDFDIALAQIKRIISSKMPSKEDDASHPLAN